MLNTHPHLFRLGGFVPVPPHLSRDWEPDDRVLSAWCYMAGLYGDNESLAFIVSHITAVNDHKGVLAVYSTVGLPLKLKELLKQAWLEAGDGCDSVEFLINQPPPH